MKLGIVQKGLEYGQVNTSKFNVKEQVEKFLQSENAQIIACGTCLAIRKQGSTKERPEGRSE